ncbi:MAG TPA: recombinase family protein [Symbiobacteriaceae bacterium]|nr:recombinase family protein [Symbiobacteriaceae bacterium]
MYELKPPDYSGLYQDGALIPWKRLTGCCQVGPRTENAAAIYARVSSDEQLDDGESFDEQIRRAKEKCDQDGIDLWAIFLDPGQSATKKELEERDGAWALQRQLARRPYLRKVYMYRRDRFARRSWEWVRFYEVCRQKETQIDFTSGGELPVAMHGDYSVVSETFMGLLAEVEGITLRVRSADKNKAKRDRGEPFGEPYGYKKNKSTKELTPHDDEAPVVRYAFEKVALGWHPRDVAKSLQSAYPQSRRDNKPWTYDHVKDMLTKQVYRGYVTHSNGVLIRSEYVKAPIIREDLFQAVSVRMESLLAGKGPRVATRNFLKDLLVCAECGQDMNPGQSNDSAVYSCCSRVLRDQIHLAVINACKKHVASMTEEDIRTVLCAGVDRARQRIAELLGTVQQIEMKVQIYDAELLEAESERRRKDLRRRIDEECDRLDSLESQIKREEDRQLNIEHRVSEAGRLLAAWVNELQRHESEVNPASFREVVKKVVVDKPAGKIEVTCALPGWIFLNEEEHGEFAWHASASDVLGREFKAPLDERGVSAVAGLVKLPPAEQPTDIDVRTLSIDVAWRADDHDIYLAKAPNF